MGSFFCNCNARVVAGGTNQVPATFGVVLASVPMSSNTVYTVFSAIESPSGQSLMQVVEDDSFVLGDLNSISLTYAGGSVHVNFQASSGPGTIVVRWALVEMTI